MNQEQLLALIAKHTPKPKRKSDETKLLPKLITVASRCGTRLFRNQRGKYRIGTRWIKYGLGANGSSDLIGYTVRVVTPDMVGQKIAIFTAIEAKAATGRATDQQQEFVRQVQFDGGIAQIIRSVQELEITLKRP